MNKLFVATMNKGVTLLTELTLLTLLTIAFSFISKLKINRKLMRDYPQTYACIVPCFPNILWLKKDIGIPRLKSRTCNLLSMYVPEMQR